PAVTAFSVECGALMRYLLSQVVDGFAVSCFSAAGEPQPPIFRAVGTARYFSRAGAGAARIGGAAPDSDRRRRVPAFAAECRSPREESAAGADDGASSVAIGARPRGNREPTHIFARRVRSRAMQFAIRLDDLRVSYGRVRALDGLTLAVPRGEIYGFLGRNGAGKTTTLHALMGIVRPAGGEIELLGRRMRRVPVAIKRSIGYVSQAQSFYPWMTAARLGRFVGSFYPTWDDEEFKRLLRVLDV